MLAGPASHLVVVEGETHVARVFAFLALLLRDEGNAEVGSGHLLEVLAQCEVVVEQAHAFLSGLWDVDVAGVAELAESSNSIGLFFYL